VEVPFEALSPARRLAKLYVAALCAAALLSIVTQILVQHALSQQPSNARFINLAGRQRMLGRPGQTQHKTAPIWRVRCDGNR
jgi:hypothetical protein